MLFPSGRDTYDASSYPDKVRGLLNEGGLFGERQGWHLPGFDTSGWEARELSTGLPNGAAGVGFFVTTFDLDIPAGTDVPISFQFEETNDQPYRALVFVNGWQFGKRVANVGPQTKRTGRIQFQSRRSDLPYRTKIKFSTRAQQEASDALPRRWHGTRSPRVPAFPARTAGSIVRAAYQ